MSIMHFHRTLCWAQTGIKVVVSSVMAIRLSPYRDLLFLSLANILWQSAYPLAGI